MPCQKIMTFDEARQTVLREIPPRRSEIEGVHVFDRDRVLAEEIFADRDYPPFARSSRDGFAVRAADLPGELKVIGEARAGGSFEGEVRQGSAVEIMTGAPMPPGADAVVMVEHVKRIENRIVVSRSINAGENFTPQGTEAMRGDVVLEVGHRIGYAETGLLAMVGYVNVRGFCKPRVAIVPTGDEIVDSDPLPHQIRNSNAWSLFAQVRRAGAVPRIQSIARDSYESTRASIEEGLKSDLLLLSGGVSAGKYDIVEQVLADLGAKFFFTRVKIQPGQPLVFGAIGPKFFFGLPGNPASTMVTFELFARAAIERLSGIEHPMLPLLRAKLTRDFQHKPGLTRFLPARLSEDGSTIEPLGWQGSGDIPALARANAFLVAEADRESWKEGDDIRVLLK
jgi:molybdopterin molybdotransferase